MEMSSFVVSWSPVIVLTILAVFFGTSAFQLSIYGLLFSMAVSVFYFNTPLWTIFLAAIDGSLTTFPLLLVIMAGIFLSSLLILTGSISRIVQWFEQGVGDAFRRNLLITFGLGNFMEGSGVIAEPVVAPMLKESGVSAHGSAALSIVGYAGLMTLELGGIIVTVLAMVTGLPIDELGVASAWLSIPATITMAICAITFLPRPAGGWNVGKFMLVVTVGAVLGFVSLAAVVTIGVPMSAVVAGSLIILAFTVLGSGKLQFDPEIIKDMAPFIFMLSCMLCVNTVPYLYQLTYEKLIVKISLIPIHTITFRPFFSAYIYLFLAFVISTILLRISGEMFVTIVRNGLNKAWRSPDRLWSRLTSRRVIAICNYLRLSAIKE